ncbi:MAG: hypothetical protein IKC60_04480, partial [Clostridia bacterium]|nr:hypothetical protein [Clostridia bacterium]
MYKYFNPHPKGLLTNDCVKRAIVVATGMDYLKVQRELNEYKAVTGSKKFNSIKNLRYVVAVLNAKKTTFQKELTAEVSAYLNLAVYTLFRQLYMADNRNPNALFSVPAHLFAPAA